MIRRYLLLVFLFISCKAFSQDSTFIKVHFLYGSKPLSKYKKTEKKWFGGILGGHVGIEGDSNRIVDFTHNGKFHVFAKNSAPHSHFTQRDIHSFYSTFGGNPDSVKKIVVYIPVTQAQKLLFDSITTSYLHQTPYDYALFGMRCSAAAYDILGKLDIMPAYSYGKTYKKIFYPKKLRKRILEKARKKSWKVEQHEGSCKRKWERD